MSQNIASDFGKELVEHLKSLTSETSGKKSENQQIINFFTVKKEPTRKKPPILDPTKPVKT